MGDAPSFIAQQARTEQVSSVWHCLKLMVQVDNQYLPLNIADDSILPRQGKMLPLRILFGFTSPHASNTLKYAEKIGGDPVESYRRKARYYLHVKNGYGEVKRAFYYK